MRRSTLPVVLAATALTALTGCLAGPAGPVTTRVPVAPIAGPPPGPSAPGPSPHGQTPPPPPPRAAAPDTARGAAVRAENARPGTPKWRIPPGRAAAPGLEGYAGAVSVLPGTPVPLYLRGTGEVRVTALRTGWYGGIGARAVWTGRMRATAQPAPVVDDAPVTGAGGLRGARTVLARWRASGTVPTAGWPEGHYLLRLDGDRASRQIPLTVRSGTAAGRVLVVAATMTWQAYNSWGGRSLYRGPAGPAGPAGGDTRTRSLAVDYDRPYDRGAGAGDYPVTDAPLVRQAERAGLPLAWATDLDLAERPELMDGATAVAFGGHAEYLTARTARHLDRALDGGTNLAVFGANTAYWRVRVAGRRVVSTRRAALDPLSRTDPDGTTVRFADTPGSFPEQRLLGVRTECFPARAQWVVSDPTWFGFRGTGVRAGTSLGRIVGVEFDAVPPDAPATGGAAGIATRVVARSPVTCRGRRTAHTAVWVGRPSGAGVFSAATLDWTCALEDACRDVSVRAREVELLGRVTRTVLTAMAAGPAARSGA